MADADRRGWNADAAALPRTLFVTPLAFNTFTGGGVTFSNLFRGWPKDRLFTVHQDSLPLSTDVCANYYALGPSEIRLAGPLETVRRQLSRHAAQGPDHKDKSARAAAAQQSEQDSKLRSLVLQGARLVFGNAGLPMIARLSEPLVEWIGNARPDVLYTILGSAEMMELTELIRRRFALPTVIHIMDDWRSERARGGLLSPLMRRRLVALFDEAARTATGHLAICDAMADAYGKDYGVTFETVQNVLDSDAWLRHARVDAAARTPARLLYAGSIYADVQLQSLMDVAAAVASLRGAGKSLSLDVMCPEFMIAPHRAAIESHDGVRVVPQVARNQYFPTVCDADVLLLPVNFSSSAYRMVRYSMPTKVPEYLVSGVPVFLYGPEGVAQVSYALREGWGHAVTRRDPQDLQRELLRVVEDDGLRKAMVGRARRTAAERHDATAVRGKFREALIRAASEADQSRETS